jgi:hypothetical protein
MIEPASGRFALVDENASATRVRLEKKHDGRWLVECEGVLRAWWEPDCLEWAAYTAVHFAQVMQLGQPQLGAGVPADALELGRLAAERFAAEARPSTLRRSC